MDTTAIAAVIQEYPTMVLRAIVMTLIAVRALVKLCFYRRVPAGSRY